MSPAVPEMDVVFDSISFGDIASQMMRHSFAGWPSAALGVMYIWLKPLRLKRDSNLGLFSISQWNFMLVATELSTLIPSF